MKPPFKARENEVRDRNGLQACVILPTNISKSLAHRFAKECAAILNEAQAGLVTDQALRRAQAKT